MDTRKLPKWAQALIAEKDRQIDKLTDELEARRAIDQAHGSELLSPSWQSQGAVLDPHRFKIPIGDGHVRYSFDKQYDHIRLDHIDVRLSDQGGRHIEIQGSHRLIIRPVASNMITLLSTRE